MNRPQRPPLRPAEEIDPGVLAVIRALARANARRDYAARLVEPQPKGA